METAKILTCGVFDCLHQGHLNLFWKLSKMGELYVAVVCDVAVKAKKGQNRPIMNEEYRVSLISNLRCVTLCAIIDDFTFDNFWAKQCDIIAVGEDQTHFHGLDKIPQEKKIILPRTEGVSTSNIIERLK